MLTCDEFATRLDDYCRGVLPADVSAALEFHVEGCPECLRLLERLEPALPATTNLPDPALPADDLWSGIRERIGRGRHTPGVRLSWRALAAAAVLLMAVTSGATMLLLRERHPVPAPPSTRLGTFEAEYAAAARDLTTALERDRSRISPEAMAAIERNLAVVNAALAEVRRALDRDPGNTVLEQLVADAWQQKMDLLRRAAALSGAS